jgi:diguanylate cyclase (GGDEF)-like protein/PAS domain S-box-containing protein
LKPARWVVSAALSFVGAVALHASDAMHRWNDLLIEKYSLWTQREVPSDVVVVGIDSHSIAQLNSWPWPRGHHARVLDFLRNASASRVFIDIDFSSASRAQDDELLAVALSRWERERVVLPLFLQTRSGSDKQLTLTKPLPLFAGYATLASVNLVPDRDSIVRVAEPSWNIEGRSVPSVFSALSPTRSVAASMAIDYSISPASFAYYSFVDILQGRVPLEELRGKTVLIGATALELGDMQPVPVHRTLPGVVIHALAIQTAAEGPVTPVSRFASIAVLAAWTLVLAWLMGRAAWTMNIFMACCAGLAALGVGVGAYHLRLRFDTLPLIYAAAGCFIAATLTSLDAANLRARILGRLANKRRAVLDSVFTSSYDAILWVEASGTIISTNDAGQQLLGCAQDDLVGRPISAFLTDQFPQASVAGLAALNGRIIETEITASDGQRISVEISTTLAEHEEGRQFTLILRDLRERRAQEARLHHQATHDALTGLPNRFVLIEELEKRAIDPAIRNMAVLSLNLTRFKAVNETLGHDAGDTVLCGAAFRLESVLAGRGLIARMDGDSFAILAECDGNRNRLLSLVRDLGESLRRPFEYEGIPIGIGVNIGVACYPTDGADGTTLLKNASIAMYGAKRTSDDVAFYDPEANEHSVRRLALIGELIAAIENDALDLHYQPKVALQTGLCDSVEALLRWNHPVHGSISPGELIPLIEPTELLRPLTEWTIRRALLQHLSWGRQGTRIRMAVNLSARLLQDLSFPDRLAEILAAHDLSPGALELEITESANLQDLNRALTVGRRIRELGVALSVDDYGTGHSSLAYLRDLSVSTLKLDRTFVDDLQNSSGNRFIVESTLALAHALRLDVVAEGIETQWQADYLRQLGYDYGQGYFFSRPLDADNCLKWISARAVRPSDTQAKVA